MKTPLKFYRSSKGVSKQHLENIRATLLLTSKQQRSQNFLSCEKFFLKKTLSNFK